MHPLDDTIAAIATPVGEGGLAIVRLSGKNALTIADTIFEPGGKVSRKPTDAESHTLQYGRIVIEGKTIDEVMLAIMKAPRTFTREDTVEISCHGGILTTQMILAGLLANGARMAEPGEFTKRAFLNGRIDLTQAEAVADLIHSRTELSLAAANEQLAGKLAERINRLRDDLMHILAHVEAHIDFPDEDISPHTHGQLLTQLQNAVGFMDQLLQTAYEGQVLRKGIRAAIVGRPNVGKSSLLNQLLGHNRAIVSPIPGTTRDTIEETANIRGIPVVFIDTAGLRQSEDVIEAEGIRRSRQTLESAELILQVLDVSEEGFEEQIEELEPSKKRIVVFNKIDLAKAPLRQETDGVGVSCLTGEGLEALKDAIKTVVWSGEIKAESLQVMINARHRDALRRARMAAEQTKLGLSEGRSLDLVAIDLREAVQAIGEIVGKTTTEDLLDSIFSTFCIGK